MHQLSARILGGGHDVRMIYAFAPQVILYCFNEVFSELGEFKRVNIAWNGWDKNKWRSVAGKIEIDPDHPRNRGPVFEQGFQTPEGQDLIVHIDRYSIEFSSERPILDPWRARIREFLLQFKFNEYVGVIEEP